MAFAATHKFARISAKKVRQIARLIRGRPVTEAGDILRFLPNRGARLLEKVLQSAQANAEYARQERDLKVPPAEQMVVVEARVDEGPRVKRVQPHARGIAFLIQKRMAHIHVAIDEEDAS